MNSIQPNAYVVLEYTLTDDAGDVIDASEAEDGEPIEYVHGYGMLVPGLEVALDGLKVGETKKVVVEPADGFGDRDEELVLDVERSEFPNPKKVEVGDEFIAESPDGDEVPMRVIEVDGDSVVVDANHPLAGVVLHYDVKVREIRPATDEEIADAAEAFEEAGYAACDDPTHDHGGAPTGPGDDLVKLRTKTVS